MTPLYRLCAIVAMCAPGVARGDIVSLAPSRDNTIYEFCGGGCPDGGSNGAGETLFAGRTGGFGVRRALLHFDVAANIPIGATITTVQLTLDVSDSSSGQSNDLSLHLLEADWGEGASNAGNPGGAGALPEPGDASWLYRFYNNELWSAPGAEGDYVITASATRQVDAGGPTTWSSAQLVTDVQGWLDSPPTNFGWIVIGGEVVGGTSRRMGSREASDPDTRPVLFIEYATPPERPEPPAVPAATTLGLYVLSAVLLMAVAYTASRG